MDNKFYRIDISKFDPTNASAEDIRKWLFAIIDAELEKDSEDRDYDLIEECSEFEAELPLSDTDIELSESDYVAGLERIKAQIPATEYKETKILRPKKKTKKSIRIIAILAASLATLMISLTVAAAVQGVPVMQFISENFKNILCMDSGDKLDDGSVTLVKYGEVLIYSSMEEAIRSIDSNMLYPTHLPDGIEIRKIIVTNVENKSQMKILYVTGDASLSIAIYANADSTHEDWEHSTVYEDAVVDFTIIYVEGEFQAVGVHNNMRYSIKYNDYDELINILNGMKEIGK